MGDTEEMTRRVERAERSERGPVRRRLVSAAVVVSVLAALTPLDEIASLANAGTLCAFVAVAACVLVLRRRDPGARRPFRTPAAWVIAPLAIAGCLYLFSSLQTKTHWSFLIWNAIGLVIYFLYARRRSLVTS